MGCNTGASPGRAMAFRGRAAAGRYGEDGGEVALGQPEGRKENRSGWYWAVKVVWGMGVRFFGFAQNDRRLGWGWREVGSG